MRYTIRKENNRSAYIQLYEQMRDDITEGVYPYESRMPSKRLVAAETGVSVITVEHAYAILCDEGYIDARERSGYYVIYRDTDVLPVIGDGTAPSEKTAGGTPHFMKPTEASGDPSAPSKMTRGRSRVSERMPYSVMAKTMRRVLTARGEKILERSPSGGLPEFRSAVASYLARSRGIRVSPDQIVIGSGSEYLYSLVVQVLGRQRIYALEDPSYEKIHRMYEVNGVTCEFLKMGPDGILTPELLRTRAEVLHVTPYNSYPSGVTATASKRREYINWASARNGIIIEDDFDSEFTVSSKPEDTLFSLEPEKSVIYLNTFTQTVGPSVRIGYMILPAGMTDLFQKKVGFYASTVPTFEQYVLTELIESGDFERHINRVRRNRRRELEEAAKNRRREIQ
ncbi:MAG: PLP-dependent aminotransferase family protein [Eubacteriales bacterium]|jgi:GntR family transcriptional regulator/MocR family aminotransferase